MVSFVLVSHMQSICNLTQMHGAANWRGASITFRLNGHGLSCFLQHALQSSGASNATTLVLTCEWTLCASGVSCRPPVAPWQCRTPDIGLHWESVTASVLHARAASHSVVNEQGCSS